MEKKPNIIIFNPDEMRWDALSHMGVNQAAVTPNFDSFMLNDAVSFSNAYCQNPVCVPSRCSFFTGLYPHVKGHRTMQHMLHENDSNLFSELKRAGYYVWMNDRNDLVAGQVPGLLESLADEVYSGMSDPRVQRNDHGKPVVSSIRGEEGSKYYYSHYRGELACDADGLCYTKDDASVDRAVEVLSQKRDKPVLAFLGLTYPHCPYGVEKPFFSAINRRLLPRRASAGYKKAQMLNELRKRVHLDSFSEQDWDELRAVYLGMCMKVDAQFKRLCDGLKKADKYDSSLIIVLSDHGDFCGDYSLPEKSQNTFEDCLVRVPLLIKPPKGCNVDPGISSSLVELVDFYATVMDYAGVKPDHDNFGTSLRPIVSDRNKEVRDYVFSEGGRMPYEWQADEYHGVSGSTGIVPKNSEYWPKQDAQRNGMAHIKGTMIRDKHHKYIMRANGEDEFYDMDADPLEERNEIDNPEYADIILKLKLEMLRWYQRSADTVPRKVDNRLSYSQFCRIVKNLDDDDRAIAFNEYQLGMGAPGISKMVKSAETGKLSV